MSKNYSRLLFCILILELAGCASWITGPSHPQTLYMLSGDSCQSKPQPNPGAVSLLIGPPRASAFLYTTKIIFSHSDQTRGSYQYAFWTDAPPDRLAMNIEQELECRGTFSKVSRNSFPADYILRFELLDFHHDISNSPGKVFVEISAEIMSAHTGALLAKQHFASQLPVPTFDAEGAVAGFNATGKAIVGDIADWLSSAVKGKH